MISAATGAVALVIAPLNREHGHLDKVVIDLSAAHIWDASSVAPLDAIETKYAQRGKSVEITGLNEPSARIHKTLSGELTGGH
jgi:SulP family sulfate permease